MKDFIATFFAGFGVLVLAAILILPAVVVYHHFEHASVAARNGWTILALFGGIAVDWLILKSMIPKQKLPKQ